MLSRARHAHLRLRPAVARVLGAAIAGSRPITSASRDPAPQPRPWRATRAFASGSVVETPPDDMFLNLASHSMGSKILAASGLPVPPQLRRGSGPFDPAMRPSSSVSSARLLGTAIVVATRAVDGAHTAASTALAKALGDQSAGVVVDDGSGPVIGFWTAARDAAAAAAAAAGEADGDRGTHSTGGTALVVDATWISNSDGLRWLFWVCQRHLSNLGSNSRVLFVTRRPADVARGGDVAGASAARAVQGFARSYAKETGYRGTNANVITVSDDVLDAGDDGSDLARSLGDPAWFFCSDRSAFVSAQVLELGSEAVESGLPNGQQHACSGARSLTGSTALVTGASRGIGASIAQQLAWEGAHVVAVDVEQNSSALERLAAAIGGTALVGDVTSKGTHAEIVDQMVQRGGCRVLVHNAGITMDKSLKRMKPDAFDRVLKVNLDAIMAMDEALYSTDGAMRSLTREVVLSSINGIAGARGQTNYAASKAALIGYVQAMAPSLAARGGTVNAVAPGFIETTMTQQMPALPREMGRRTSCFSQGGWPADVAAAITFLALPGAHAVTGQVLRVCGGNIVGA